MKTSIRQGVFETNSSSVHSCSICTEDTYKKFNDGELWIRQQWNDEDEYLPVDEAIEKNIEYFKTELEDVSEEDWSKFKEVYKETKSNWEAFNAIGEDWDELKYNDLDYDKYFMSVDDYWSIHEYEDWSKKFKDANGTPMIAWGYVGHD
jgi:hypothetical protein